MRVLMRTRQSDRAEDGAVAVMVAAFAIAMFMLAAFVVDFGVAYNSKRQLQTAADAGALAALQVYKGRTGDCSALKDNPALATAAESAADSLASENYSGVAAGNITVTCSVDGKSLTVAYDTAGTTGTTFGTLAGVDSITTSREAAATIGNSTRAVGGMRPWGVCSAVLETTGNVAFVPTFNSSTSTQTSDGLCGPDNPPGGWWIAQCSGQNNGTPATEIAVRDGCPTSGYQPVGGTPEAGDPIGNNDYLTAACPKNAENDTCLTSDIGRNFHLASDEWQTLVGTRFTMPVFCTAPTCDTLAVSGGGENASYAIYAMAEVELCGFEFQPASPSTGWPTTGPCATNNPNGYTSDSVTSGGGFFLVVTRISGGVNNGFVLNEFTTSRLTN